MKCIGGMAAILINLSLINPKKINSNAIQF